MIVECAHVSVCVCDFFLVPITTKYQKWGFSEDESGVSDMSVTRKDFIGVRSHLGNLG